jgi:hypothetical protein
MSVAACVFRNRRAFASDLLANGWDEGTGETLFSDDRAFNCSVAAEECIGNLATVAWLRTTLERTSARTSESLRATFLIDGSHSGDLIAKAEVPKIKESATSLLSQTRECDSEVIDFLRKVLRLCDAAEREDNPIVFV